MQIRRVAARLRPPLEVRLATAPTAEVCGPGAASAENAPAALRARGLLPFVRPHCRIDLLLDRGQVERGGRLHRWKLDSRSCQVGDPLLYLHETPELAREEVVHISAAQIVQRLAMDRRRPLERIPTKVDDRRNISCHLFTGPAIRLLHELKLEVIDTNSAQVCLG